MAKSECGKCHEVFSSVSSFDMHRTGKYEPPTRRCITRDEMLAKGMICNERGWWTTGTFDTWRFMMSKIDDEYAS